jgi:putative transcriptional regulator
MAKHSFRTSMKQHRADRKLTQEDLALMVGARRETIVFLEQGKYVPSLKLACDIARVFDKKVEDMFFFD